MKKLFTLALLALLGSALQAQSTFTDDFESYNVGDPIGKTSAKWETWGGTTTTDDAPVSDEQAKSGTKSLKLVATAATQGGPSDIICKFGGAYISGLFDLKFDLYVKTGAYFNLQAETTNGSKWAADFYVENELLTVNVDGNRINVLSNIPFPANKWVNFNLKADITSNQWEIFLDNVSVGKFGNTLNKIASINFYPTIKGTAAKPIADLYYIDNFFYDYSKPALPVNDGCLYNFAPRNFGLAGMQYPVWVEVRNTGSGVMTKFDVMIENGKDTFVQSFSAQNMASLAIKRLNITTGVYKLLEGNQQIRARLLKVGGVTNDGNPANNLKTVNANGFIAAEDRAILIEEATGTWCTWCPRGHVFMDSLSKLYPGKFIGIAVHNGANDPMVVPEYDQGLRLFPGFPGFPSVVINRETIGDPGSMELPFLTEIQKSAPVRIQNGATFNETTGELTISVTADVKEELTGDFFLNAVIVEDSLTGTTSGWAQVNAYAGGAQGVMGGFEKLPSPVPANRMVYDHVGRAILGGYYGKQVAATLLPAGSKHHDNFKWVLGPANRKNKIKIVGVMYDADGKVVNATETTIEEAVNNGFVLNANVIANETRVAVVPNPADGMTQIAIELNETAEVSVRAFDMLGRQVSEKNYGLQAGEQLLSFSTANLEDGVYNFVIMAGNDTISRKVIVKH